MSLRDQLILDSIEKSKQDLYPNLRAIITELRAVATDKDLCIARELSASNQKTVGFMPRTAMDAGTYSFLVGNDLIVTATLNANGTYLVTRIAW